MEIVNIVFSSDDNYAQLMGVAICSIFENKKNNYSIYIYVLDGGISQKNINRLNKLEKKYTFKINYIKIDTSFFKNFYTREVYSQAAYYRIMIPRLLPYIKKILYLDCDIIVLNDIYELYNTDISNYLFAAVEDLYLDKMRHKELNIPIKEKYFNSGVLLINIDKCKEINAPETILNFVNDYPEKLEYADQDAFNATMWGNFLCLDKKYNFLSLLSESSNLNEFIKINDIKIIHYVGEKPWNYFYKNIFNIKYFYYLKKTPWKNLKYKNRTIKNIVTKYNNLYSGRKQIFLMNLLSYFEKKLSIILSGKNINNIKRIKRKLKIKFY